MNINRVYLGLATTPHDSALAIVDSKGRVVFAEGTERYLQSKRALNMPPDILKRTSMLLASHWNVENQIVAAFSWSAARRKRSIGNLQAVREAISQLYGKCPAYPAESLLYGKNFLLSDVRMELLSGEALEFELGRIDDSRSYEVVRRRYDHHLTHAAAACFTSPYQEAVCAIVDGYGENGAYAFYHYIDGRLQEINLPIQNDHGELASLGHFYEDICRACGFDSAAGEEWKVMGLACYGEHDPHLYKLFRRMLVVEDLGLRSISSAQQFSNWCELHKIRRKEGQPALSAAHIAYTAQEVFTEVLYELLNNLYAKGLSRNLILGGGCALNSSTNGGILSNTRFKNLYIFSAPGDDGNAVGAALLAYKEDHPEERRSMIFQSPYLGSSMSAETLENVKLFSGINKLTLCHEDAPERAAQLLSNGKIIGWIQGRAEFGPRALGNRSILADPRSPAIKNEINSRIKFREEFRPFAPSILHEFGDQYFEHYQESPYMERTLRFRSSVRTKVPGVVHKDGTGRLQTVKKEWNERYFRLIHRFYELTGIPLILNTSFNVMGKPIAHSVEDAIAVFYTSGLDAMFIDNLLLEK
jgi:carbamoyltransferase